MADENQKSAGMFIYTGAFFRHIRFYSTGIMWLPLRLQALVTLTGWMAIISGCLCRRSRIPHMLCHGEVIIAKIWHLVPLSPLYLNRSLWN